PWQHPYGLPTIVSNTCNNYGPWQFPEKLIPLVLLNALEGRELPVYGDGSNRRDWLFVEDHAEGLVRVLLHWESRRNRCDRRASAPQQPRGRHAHLRCAGRTASRSGRPAHAADPFRYRPAR